MKKRKQQYSCNNCGALHGKWAGKCDECNQWNTIQEIKVHLTSSNMKIANNIVISTLDEPMVNMVRIDTHISELNRALGGGLVMGSATLISGDPGIGKSTLLLQLAASLDDRGRKCLYVSGEESLDQIKLRAKRLGLSAAKVNLVSAIMLKDIIAVINNLKNINVVVIDSIQTLYHDEIASSPGTVSQVRTCAFELIQVAKRNDIAVIMVGHVTKDGQIAGPKVLEHMVDSVLYFEGEKNNNFRIVRAIKNRFGAANEIGVFKMEHKGLIEVTSPSEIFLSMRHHNISGYTIFAGIEGTRPVLVEVQALVAPSFLAIPRRAVVGWDSNRLAMMIAVLKARLNINLMDKEVYLNIAGGLKIQEPAADLAVVAALISALTGIALPEDMVFFAEVGLSGELRQVSQIDARLQEAEKMGFRRAVMPETKKNNTCKIIQNSIKHIEEVKKLIIG